jgi:hypothetical protein
MGTSINQASPKSSNWKPVLASYSKQGIQEERVIKEIWRASENEEVPISQEIKSDLVFQCFKAVESSTTFREAMMKFNEAIISSKKNSIIAEFAKRIIPSSFQGENPAEQWKGNLFTEVTKYVVSRDASGFVGESYRNKSVNELIEFKRRLGSKVAEIVKAESTTIKSKRDWNNFVDTSIKKLKFIK